MFNHAYIHQTERDQLLDKDIWNAEEIGIEPNHASSLRKLNFTRIKPDWLNTAVKKFVRLQSSVRTINTCRTYITTLIHFGDFIRSQTSTRC